MNAPQLWNDHTFRVLLDDLFRARKDNSLGPIRLQAIMDYAERMAGVEGPSAQPLTARTMAPGFVLDDDDSSEEATPPIPPRSAPSSLPSAKSKKPSASSHQKEPIAAPPKSYLEARRAERKDPNASLREAADLVQEAIKAGRWDASGTMVVNIPRTYVVAGLEAILKERRVPFSSLTVSLPPKQQKIDIESASARSGSAGERTGGWAIVLTK